MQELTNKRKVTLSVLALLVVVALVAAFYAEYMLGQIQHDPMPRADVDLSIAKDAVKRSKAAKTINVLVLGSDRRSGEDRGRSDAIMVLTLDQKTGVVKVTSVMRDTYVHIPGHGSDRVNAAYAYGGPALTIKTLNANFGLDIRDYVEIDFAGLKDVVDELGGLRVDVDELEASGMRGSIRAGKQRLSGQRTLEYVRLRKVDSDFQRTRRQREVLGLLIDKVREGGIAGVPSTVRTLSPFVKTSLSRPRMLRLALTGMQLSGGERPQMRIPVNDGYSAESRRGMQVLVPDIEYNKLKVREFVYGE